MPKRYIIAAICFFGFANSLILRSALSVTITQMVEATPVLETTIRDVSICPKPEVKPSITTNSSTPDLQPNHENSRFAWSQEVQGLILSAFFYGYAASHIPAGLFVQKIGAKSVLLVSIFCSGIVSLVTPIGVELGGAAAMITLRIVMGICQGGLFPAVAALIAAWIPMKERGLLAGIIYNGLSASGITL